MQIREIHIDGFGIFHDRHIRNIPSGASVLYGPNEFGKTTLLNFIRRILFGFRTPASSAQYPALTGGSYGGKLVCEFSNGQVVTIARKEGRFGGPVTLYMGSREVEGQEELNKLLGQITQKFYENVYAIGLDELQAVNTLEEKEIKTVIYGPGIELGASFFKKVSDHFTKPAESIFKPGGSTQRMAILFKEIREKEKEISGIKDRLSDYDKLVRESGKLQDAIKELDKELEALELQRRLLETQEKLYPAYINMKEAEKMLAETPANPFFNESSLNELEKLELAADNRKKQVQSEAEELGRLRLKKDSLDYDAKIIEVEILINSLQKKSQQYADASRDIIRVKLEKENLSSAIAGKLEKLGPSWSAERVDRFVFSLEMEDFCRNRKDSFSESQREIDNIKNRLQMRRDTLAAEKSRKPTGHAFYKYAGIAGMLFGLAGVILGIASSQPLFTGLSVLFLLTGLGVFLFGRNRQGKSAPDPLEKQYTDELEVARANYNNLTQEWQSWLQANGLNNQLSPESALEFFRTVREIRKDLESLKGLQSRIDQMQSSLDDVESSLSRVFNALGREQPGAGVIAIIDALAQQLDTAKIKRNEKAELESRIKETEDRLARLLEEQKKAESELLQYIEGSGSEDAAGFRRNFEAFKKRESQKQAFLEAQKIIQSNVGIGEAFDTFLATIASTTPTEISVRLDQVKARMAECKDKQQQYIHSSGEIRNQIKGLCSDTEMTVKQGEVEILKQQLQDMAAEWVRSQAAKFALDRAEAKYERTRQPEVIKTAGEIFASITDQAYTALIKPAESDDLKILSPSAERKKISELSRGTKEQLYLSMRLSLIEVNDKSREPMPVIMDDILVNFDDRRTQTAAKVLVEFARSRQVIIFTCHQDMLELYQNSGASVIILE